MFFRQILHEGKACLSYLVGCPTLGVCVAVDPQEDPQRYVEDAGAHGMKIVGVIETHVHADHLSAAPALARQQEVPLYMGPGAEVRYEHETLADAAMLRVGNRRIKAFHTPGHTPEHIALYIDNWFLLTGDTLFVGDVGRVDLALDGIDDDEIRRRALTLHESIRRLMAFPEWTEIYPGHYSGSVCGRGMDGKTVSTVGREKYKNRPLRLSAEEFADFQVKDRPPLPANFHMIKMQNLGQMPVQTGA